MEVGSNQLPKMEGKKMKKDYEEWLAWYYNYNEDEVVSNYYSAESMLLYQEYLDDL